MANGFFPYRFESWRNKIESSLYEFVIFLESHERKKIELISKKKDPEKGAENKIKRRKHQ